MMPQKRYRPQEIIAKLRKADVLLGERERSRTSFPFVRSTDTNRHEDYRAPLECERMPWEQAHLAGVSDAPSR
jgi:hypothetical protein